MQFIPQANRYRIVSNEVEGQLLMHILERGEVEKQLFQQYLHEIVEQLILFEQYSKETQYRYMNPYCIVISKASEVLLLNLEVDSNQFVMKYLQQREVRDHFIVYPMMDTNRNIKHQGLFNFGRTLEFFLSHCEIQPPFTSREIKKYNSIIQACCPSQGEQEYQVVRDIVKDIPKISKIQSSPLQKHRPSLLKLAVIVVVLLLALFVKSQLKQTNIETGSQVVQAAEGEDDSQTIVDEAPLICMSCEERAEIQELDHEEIKIHLLDIKEAISESTNHIKEDLFSLLNALVTSHEEEIVEELLEQVDQLVEEQEPE